MGTILNSVAAQDGGSTYKTAIFNEHNTTHLWLTVLDIASGEGVIDSIKARAILSATEFVKPCLKITVDGAAAYDIVNGYSFKVGASFGTLELAQNIVYNSSIKIEIKALNSGSDRWNALIQRRV